MMQQEGLTKMVGGEGFEPSTFGLLRATSGWSDSKTGASGAPRGASRSAVAGGLQQNLDAMRRD
jgi:hypothetical protein